MKLTRINYNELTSKQKEIYNFQKVAGVLADFGYNCIKLSDDWQGADFLAYHKDEDKTMKIQLKGRMTIDKRYIGKNLYMCFRIGHVWHLILHDELLRIVEEISPWTLKNRSWEIDGNCNWGKPSKTAREKLSAYALEPVRNET